MRATQNLLPSLGASALLHGVVLVFALRSAPPTLSPALAVIPVSLVDLPGGGGGGPAAGAVAAPAGGAAPAEAPLAAPEPPRAPARAVKKPPRTLARVPAPSPAAPLAEEPHGAGNGDGNGDGGAARGGPGGGGDGSGGARVAYGTNPLPPYPMVARRLGKEGVVLLEVVVAPDGHATAVRVVKSSGFAALDQSAATTVRERWRFIPARRGATAVESRVEVPIRFRLDDLRS